MSSTKHWDNSRQLSSYLVTASIAIVAVILRLISRRRTQISFGWDDLFSVLATTFFTGYCALGAWMLITGVFTPYVNTLSPKQLEDLLLGFWASILLVNTAITCAKLAVLCFYLRLFGVRRQLKILTYILMAVSVTWYIGVCLVSILRCIPVRAAWDITLEGKAKCLNEELIALVGESINCFTEFLMILLPINTVRKLQLPLRQRIGVSAVFALGFFTVITSIVRLVEGTNLKDQSIGVIETALWINIQLCTAIVTGCMPTYRGLLPSKQIKALLRRFRLLSSTKESSSDRNENDWPTPRDVKHNRIVYKGHSPKLDRDAEMTGITIMESERSMSQTTAHSGSLKRERSAV